MKRLILLSLLLQGFLVTAPTSAQCDEFAKAILEIVRRESYQKLSQHFEPKEAKRTRMQWPEGEDATKYLNDLEEALQKDLVIGLKGFREGLQKQGWDLSKATYVGCERTHGKSSIVKIKFKIYNRDESLLVPTYDGDAIYITNVMMDGKKGLANQYQSYTLVGGERYLTFKPRQDELTKGIIHLKRFLQNEEISDYKEQCTLGLTDFEGIPFLEYLVLYGETNMYVHVNIESGHCKEIFK